MNTTQAQLKKDSLLLRMAADRQRLNAWTKPAGQRSDLLDFADPVTQRWLMTGGLMLLSALKLPTFLKVPLRTAATISLRNRVAALFNAPPPAAPQSETPTHSMPMATAPHAVDRSHPADRAVAP